MSYFAMDREAFARIRKRLSSKVSPACVSVMRFLVIEAAWSPTTWHGVEISRGQIVASNKRIREETGLSEKTVRSCLLVLKKAREIDTQPAAKGRPEVASQVAGEVASQVAGEVAGFANLITVCNYDTYDASKSPSGEVSGRASGIASGEPSGDRQEVGKEQGKKEEATYTAVTPLIQVPREAPPPAKPAPAKPAKVNGHTPGKAPRQAVALEPVDDETQRTAISIVTEFYAGSDLTPSKLDISAARALLVDGVTEAQLRGLVNYHRTSEAIDYWPSPACWTKYVRGGSQHVWRHLLERRAARILKTGIDSDLPF